MRRHLFWWEAGGVLFVSAVGSLLHFVYEWSGGSVAAAILSAVNESTWEHMKLLLVPMLIYSVAQMCLMGAGWPNFLAVRAVSTLVGLGLIPVLFYTYSGVLGYHLGWGNIVVFFLAVLGAFVVDYRLLRRGRLSAPWQQIAGLLTLWVLLFCFVWCTFHPSRLGLWQDPVTGRFGV